MSWLPVIAWKIRPHGSGWEGGNQIFVDECRNNNRVKGLGKEVMLGFSVSVHAVKMGSHSGTFIGHTTPFVANNGLVHWVVAA